MIVIGRHADDVIDHLHRRQSVFSIEDIEILDLHIR